MVLQHPGEVGRAGGSAGSVTEVVARAVAEESVPVLFLSDSTGISAETMGNALLIQFPDVHFERASVPFIDSPEQALSIVAELDAALDSGVTPLVFCTAADTGVRTALLTARAPVIDLFDMHMQRVEQILGRTGEREAMRLHGVGDIKRYNARMAAVEFTIEHDDGQSLRALDKADVILLAPSRCGKTPTSMYLALQHGFFVANYPLVDEDLELDKLPRPVEEYRERCFGLTTTVERLSRVRSERRRGSRYASSEQCRWELRRAATIYDRHRIPVIDSSEKSVEEMATLILQQHVRQVRAAARDGQ
ncbi:pyruvate, water dikinase regulatory protein [Nocardioides bruguierae]|uniref:Putative phosphoenolpyruvate synthase regulatory protein n=1 Tax=Nocardioides bruguierae TaxID=2945102 RepID=A0A9X2D9V7_9ACTN|nr:pyruvate, water dikinase regulatory protein [Nocardioides bruguierae]MCM0621482.1 kinase/pyrophosphorylase [Nocardioides bruguierae]